MTLKNMPKKINYKVLAISIAALIFAPTLTWLYVKTELSRRAAVYDTNWSESGECYINAYISKYSSLGALGKLVGLFSSNGFYRVYTKSGVELESSEWLLLQREYPDMEAAKWANGYAIYPTGDGYQGWRLPECN